MSEAEMIFVDFRKYCRKCKYKKESEFKEGSKCDECVEVPARNGSSIPINFERRDRG